TLPRRHGDTEARSDRGPGARVAADPRSAHAILGWFTEIARNRRNRVEQFRSARMIQLEISRDSELRLQDSLNAVPPRVMAQVHRTMQTFVYQGVQAGIQKYFAGWGPKGGPTTSLLTSRSGALANSLLESAQVGIDPPSPGADTTRVTLRLG